MNFMKYPTKNDISISNAVLKLAKLQNAERLELTAATGAVIVTSGRMTAKELLSTVQSLTGRAAELMTLLRLTCGDCTNCSEECAYRDKSITELIRPAVVIPDWARQDAGLAGDAKLDCYVDEYSGCLLYTSLQAEAILPTRAIPVWRRSWRAVSAAAWRWEAWDDHSGRIEAKAV